MLSLRPITQWSSIQAEKSIVTAFSEAGFKTFWLSTQDVDGWAGVIPLMANEAANVRYFADSFDGTMLGQLRQILNVRGPSPRKVFIVLHTKGSHFEYLRRYPQEFSVFSTPNPSRRDALVDAYDNSVYYTDWWLNEVISMLSEQRVQAALLFSSDHGENLLDDGRQLLGHTRGTSYDLAAAAFLWVSDPLRQARGELISNAEEHAKLPLNLSNLPHSMLQLAGIQTSGSETKMSIFSPQFESQPRFYMLGGSVLPETSASTPK
jgi:heptose-I-phosphate ethanolaminephosphotransferase